MFVLRAFEGRVLERLCFEVLRRFSFGAVEGESFGSGCVLRF